MEATKTSRITLPETVGPDARVWIYQASRQFTNAEADELRAAASQFTSDWQAHGTNLIAAYGLYFNRFLALFVDESRHGASGCSIDSSLRFVQALEKKFNMNLLGRTQVAYFDNGEVQTVEMNQMLELFNAGRLNVDTLVFNNLVGTKGEMETKWIGPISESWHARILA